MFCCITYSKPFHIVQENKLYNLIVLLTLFEYRSETFKKKFCAERRDFVRAIDKLLKSKSIAFLLSTDLVINRLFKQ